MMSSPTSSGIDSKYLWLASLIFFRLADIIFIFLIYLQKSPVAKYFYAYYLSPHLRASY